MQIYIIMYQIISKSMMACMMIFLLCSLKYMSLKVGQKSYSIQIETSEKVCIFVHYMTGQSTIFFVTKLCCISNLIFHKTWKLYQNNDKKPVQISLFFLSRRKKSKAHSSLGKTSTYKKKNPGKTHCFSVYACQNKLPPVYLGKNTMLLFIQVKTHCPPCLSR